MLATKVGTDQAGNSYYLGYKKDYLGRKKRYVIYKDKSNESTKVPPLWHAWLHYMIDDLPHEINNYDWQQDHTSNPTGTKFAYDPSVSQGKKIALYKKWQPK